MNLSPLVSPPANAAIPQESGIPARISFVRLAAVLLLLWNLSISAAVLPSASVTLAWSPSPSPDIAGYNVLYGTESGVYLNKVSEGDTNVVTLSNLIPGVTYYFVVTCYNSVGDESVPSNEAIYTVPTNPPSLPAVLGNTALTGDGFSFTVANGAGTNFAVEASTDLINWVRVATNTAPFTFVDPDASQFAQRFYRTVAVTDGTSSDSTTSSVTPTLVTMSGPSLINGQLVYTLTDPAGARVAVEASTDLINWIPVQTNTVPCTFTDPDAGQFAQRFYRAEILP